MRWEPWERPARGEAEVSTCERQCFGVSFSALQRFWGNANVQCSTGWAGRETRLLTRHCLLGIAVPVVQRDAGCGAPPAL